jgi:hypothetical protein
VFPDLIAYGFMTLVHVPFLWFWIVLSSAPSSPLIVWGSLRPMPYFSIIIYIVLSWAHIADYIVSSVACGLETTLDEELTNLALPFIVLSVNNHLKAYFWMRCLGSMGTGNPHERRQPLPSRCLWSGRDSQVQGQLQ